MNNNTYNIDQSFDSLPQGLGYVDTSNDSTTNIVAAETISSSMPNSIQSYFHKQTSVDELNPNIPSNQHQNQHQHQSQHQSQHQNRHQNSYTKNESIINPSHAIEAAKAIALKFQTQSNSNNNPIHSHSLSTVDSLNITTKRNLSTEMYTKQSLYLHVQKHKQRLQKAMLKNFEYIARKDEESYQLQLQTLEQTKQYDHMLHHYKQRSLEIRKKKNKQNSSLTSSIIGKKAGVGTNLRKKQSKQERDIIYAHIQQAKTNNEVRKSIYIMGIPTLIHDDNHYKTEEDIQQDLHHLFQSYGPINRIKLYKNHKTKVLKGDALIVYENDDIDLDMVCSLVSNYICFITIHYKKILFPQ